jgi:hypothetical protein
MFFVDETNVVYILYSKRVLDSNFVLDDQGWLFYHNFTIIGMANVPYACDLNQYIIHIAVYISSFVHMLILSCMPPIEPKYFKKIKLEETVLW